LSAERENKSEPDKVFSSLVKTKTTLSLLTFLVKAKTLKCNHVAKFGCNEKLKTYQISLVLSKMLNRVDFVFLDFKKCPL